MKKWPNWLEVINTYSESDLKIDYGTYIIQNSKSGIVDDENFDEILNSLKFYNEDYNFVKPSMIPGINPVIDARSLNSIYTPNEGYINPNNLLDSLTKCLNKFINVIFIDNIVTDIKKDKNSGFCINYGDNQQIQAKQVLVANGSYINTVIKTLDFKNPLLPVFSGVGQALLIEKGDLEINKVIRTPNRAGACGLHILPYDKDTFYLGASNNVNLYPETHTNIGIIHFILECVMEQINIDSHKLRVKKLIAGNRPASLDGFPIIGETEIKGLWVVSGTYRDRIACSPLIADIVSDDILGTKNELSLNIFSPHRKPIQSFSFEESIDESIKHYIAGFYERGSKFPKIGMDAVLNDLMDNKIRNLYKELNINYVFNPDIFLMMELSDKKELIINFLKNYFIGLNPSPN